MSLVTRPRTISPTSPPIKGATESAPEPEAPQPAISLTVVYDPENANAGITTMASTPIEAKSSVENQSAPQVEFDTATADAPAIVEPADSAAMPKADTESVLGAEPAPVIEVTPVNEQAFAPTMVPAPAPVAPAIPEDFPVDFATEVFCPGPLLHQLSTYLPTAPTRSASSASTTGSPASAVPSRPRETAQASPCATRRPASAAKVTVRIRRNTTGGLGSTGPSIKSKNPSSNDKRLKFKSGFEPFYLLMLRNQQRAGRKCPGLP